MSPADTKWQHFIPSGVSTCPVRSCTLSHLPSAQCGTWNPPPRGRSCRSPNRVMEPPPNIVVPTPTDATVQTAPSAGPSYQGPWPVPHHPLHVPPRPLPPKLTALTVHTQGHGTQWRRCTPIVTSSLSSWRQTMVSSLFFGD